MESISFADVLFTTITLAIIYVILYYVNKSKGKHDQPDQSDSTAVTETEHEIDDRQEEQESNSL
jgi:hypothetical protein